MENGHPSMIRTLELEGDLEIPSSVFAKVWLCISLVVYEWFQVAHEPIFILEVL